MSSKSPNDPKIPAKDAEAQMDTQPQKQFGSSTDEDAIPWAEIIIEDEPGSAGKEQPVRREPLPVETSQAEGFLSRTFGTHAEYQLESQVAGPPLAVLVVVLLIFLLLVEM